MAIASSINSPVRRSLKHFYKHMLPPLTRNRIELLLGCSDYYLDVYKNSGCLFIHVPKGAGTSISHALYGRQVANHYPASLYYEISKREYSKYFVFSVVRNPWDRLVSAYKFIKQGGTQYVRPLENSIYDSQSFATFDNFVIDILDRVDLLSLDKVFWPQFHFVCDHESNVIVDYIGRFEKLDETVKKIESKTGTSLDLPYINKSSHQDDYRDHYNNETREIVGRIYVRDIELFGYTF